MSTNPKNESTIASTSYREVKIGKIIYRVTSVFLGEKDLRQTLEQLAVRKAMTDIKSGTAKATV